MIKENIDICKDTIVNKADYYGLMESDAKLHEDNEALLNSKASMQIRLNRLKIDEFLNIQDTSIFGSKFLSLDETSIPARDRDYYKLIQYIHDLNLVLNQKSEGSYSELLKMARENSDKASDIIDAIITSVSEEVFSWLSESQVEYYRQLIKQYNELIESLKQFRMKIIRVVATVILPIIMILIVSCSPSCKEITLQIPDWQTRYGECITFILKTDKPVDMTPYLSQEEIEFLSEDGITWQSEFMVVPDWEAFESFSNESFAAQYAHKRVRVTGTFFYPDGGWQNVTPVRMDFNRVDLFGAGTRVEVVEQLFPHEIGKSQSSFPHKIGKIR